MIALVAYALMDGHRGRVGDFVNLIPNSTSTGVSIAIRSLVAKGGARIVRKGHGRHGTIYAAGKSYDALVKVIARSNRNARKA
jgi:hypothetical protein